MSCDKNLSVKIIIDVKFACVVFGLQIRKIIKLLTGFLLPFFFIVHVRANVQMIK